MVKNRIFAILLLIILSLSLIPSAYAKDGSIKDLGTETDTGKQFNYQNGSFSIPGIDEQGENYGDRTQGKFWSDFLTKYRAQIVGISGAVSLTFLIFFIINFSKLGSSAGNPQMRQQAMTAIIWSGVACALTGGIGILFAFFWNILI